MNNSLVISRVKDGTNTQIIEDAIRQILSQKRCLIQKTSKKN